MSDFFGVPTKTAANPQHLKELGIPNKDMLTFVLIVAQQHKITAFQPAVFSNCLSAIKQFSPQKFIPYSNIPMAEDTECQPGKDPLSNNIGNVLTPSPAHPNGTSDPKTKPNKDPPYGSNPIYTSQPHPLSIVASNDSSTGSHSSEPDYSSQQSKWVIDPDQNKDSLFEEFFKSIYQQ